MSVYRIKNSPYWYYNITIAGKRQRRSTGERDKGQALLVEAKRRGELASAGAMAASGRITLGDAMARFWDSYAHKLSSAPTINGYIIRTVEHFGAETTLDAIDDSAVAMWMTVLRRRVSDSTANRYLSNLRSVFNAAMSAWGYTIPRPPNWEVHVLDEPDPPEDYLTRDEAQRLVAAAAPHIQPVIMFALMTGVRYANAVMLTWEQVRFDHGEIVFRTKSRRPGGKMHVLPMTSSMRSLLLSIGPKDKGRVFLKNGEPFRWIRRAYHAAVAKSGITRHITFHLLRHTAATWMVQDGVPLDVVQKVLGHANIQTTQRYAKRLWDDRLVAMERALAMSAPAVVTSSEIVPLTVPC